MIWTLIILGSVKQNLLYISYIFIPKILVMSLFVDYWRWGGWEKKLFCNCSFSFFCCKGKGNRMLTYSVTAITAIKAEPV